MPFPTKMNPLILFVALCFITACSPKLETIGSVEIVDDRLLDLIDPDARIEVLADGFTWSEGPVWVPEGDYLLFTDVPGNIMYRWHEEDGLTEFLNPSGPPAEEVPHIRAPGANGLIMGEEPNHIYVANHGKRAIIALDLDTKAETILALTYNDKKFSSPNDLVLTKNGAIFFTDPPYGLEGREESPHKEQPVNGVYRTDPNGLTHLVIDNLTLPNGVALSPDEKTLYVAVSDSKNPVLMAYDLTPDEAVTNGRIFYDFAYSREQGAEGAPDGLDVAQDGTLFVTGPGGVHILTPEGTLLGIIDPGSRVANCTIGNDGTMLYLTAHTRLGRIPLLKESL